MSNTVASYPVGAGRFEPWLFVNCYRVNFSIAHQIHVVSTNTAMSLYGIICNLIVIRVSLSEPRLVHCTAGHHVYAYVCMLILGLH